MTIENKLGKKLYDIVTSQSVVGNTTRGLMGKPSVRAAFLGGSVTFGYCPGRLEKITAFPELVGEYLSERYNDSEILNLGISGTTSLMGLVGAEMKVRDFEADIVFVEYAINDAMSRQSAESFESLVRKLMAFEKAPVVVPVCVCTSRGHTCAPMIREICTHYGLLCVDITESVYPLFGDKLNWSDYSVDEGHPDEDGSKLIADCVIKAIERLSQIPKGEAILPSPLFSARLEKLKICKDYKTDFTEKKEWLFYFDSCLEAAEKGYFEAEIECSWAACVYVSSNDEGFGTALASLDGNETCEIDAYSLFGWHNPVIEVIADSKQSQSRKLRIELADKGKKFILLCVVYC